MMPLIMTNCQLIPRNKPQEYWMKIQNFSLKKMYSKMPSAKIMAISSKPIYVMFKHPFYKFYCTSTLFATNWKLKNTDHYRMVIGIFEPGRSVCSGESYIFYTVTIAVQRYTIFIAYTMNYAYSIYMLKNVSAKTSVPLAQFPEG